MTTARNSDEPVLLQQFEVKGYKNLTQTITFGPLGRINVIHGPNNVGKSNLLQAMDLFFRLLSNPVRVGDHLTIQNAQPLSTFEKWGHPISEIFNFVKRMPIDVTGTFALTDKQREQIGFEPQSLVRIRIRVSLKANFVDVKVMNLTDGITESAITQIFELLTGVQLSQIEKTYSQFALLGVNRHLRGEEAPLPSLHIVPQQLRDALFDAKESKEVTMARRWELFVEAMKQFENILGQGRFETAFDRQSNQADLVFDKGNVRVPIDLLGSGVQQIVALLGQLLLTPAILVGIEEPELNLRYTLQKQLRDAFEQITNSEYGPEQLFLTSHSPAFEAEKFFFAMEQDKNGVPTLSRRPREMARIYTGTESEEDQYAEMHAQQPEPPAYVSSEGLVLLPENVRQTLKLEQGGGISFIPNKETGRFEIWTTDELDRWWSGDNPHADNGQ